MDIWSKIEKGNKRIYSKIPPEFIKTALDTGIPTIKKETKSWFISCPYHTDSTPSLSVIIDPSHQMSVGFWRCFSCGNSGHWNALAEKLNLPTVNDYTYDSIESDSINIETKEDLTKDDTTLGTWPWPKNKEWRNVPGSLINYYNGHRVPLDVSYPLWFLCKQEVGLDSKTVGIIRCRKAQKDGQRSYLFSKGSWITNYLWPEFSSIRTKKIVIVEGVRDALSLLALDIPALAILGAHSGMSQSRLTTLWGLGVEEIIVFMDGDKAGRQGANKIKRAIAEDIKVRVFRTWKLFPKQDPFKLVKDPVFVTNFKRWVNQ